MQIVFEAEAEAVTGPTVASPTLTNGLPSIYVNNWGAVMELAIGEFSTSCCTPLSTSLTILYTADHELMRSWSVGLSSCALPAGPPVALPGGTGPRGGAGTDAIDISNAADWPAHPTCAEWAPRPRYTRTSPCHAAYASSSSRGSSGMPYASAALTRRRPRSR